MSEDIQRPFDGEPLEEIPLDPAPLVTVLCQLRFPRVVSLHEPRSLSAFQDAIRGEYPVMRDQRSQSVQVRPDGVAVSEQQILYRFEDVASAWVVTLAQDALALETSTYTSREDFIGRIRRLFDALAGVSDPSPVAVYDRLGIRYINRLVGDDATPERLKTLTRPEVHGPLSVAEGFEHGRKLVTSITYQEFVLSDFKLLARWASLPSGGVIDPAAIQPVDEASWILDIDAFVEGQSPFTPDQAAETARRGAMHAYDLFRWVVTPEFIAEREVVGP